jgi:CheY-like chemotaxis protein
MPTVLVVEDEVMIREFVAEELNDAGFTVVIATNADHAISILENRLDIHLVFTDIDMPGSMDGLKLAAAVRDRWPPVHIIITTGKVRPFEIPANALFMPKPYLGIRSVRFSNAPTMMIGDEELEHWPVGRASLKAGRMIELELASQRSGNEQFSSYTVDPDSLTTHTRMFCPINAFWMRNPSANSLAHAIAVDGTSKSRPT